MSAKNIECRCEPNRSAQRLSFTCGYCLRNAPPPPSTSYNPNLVDLRKYADPEDRDEGFDIPKEYAEDI